MSDIINKINNGNWNCCILNDINIDFNTVAIIFSDNKKYTFTIICEDYIGYSFVGYCSVAVIESITIEPNGKFAQDSWNTAKDIHGERLPDGASDLWYQLNIKLLRGRVLKIACKSFEMKESEIFPKIRLVFSLIGKCGVKVDLDKITQKLGISPTITKTDKDFPDSIINPERKLPEELKPHYLWEMDTGYKVERVLAYQFEEILEPLMTKINVINHLQEDFSLSAQFTIGIRAQHDSWNMPRMFLTQEIVTFAAAVRANIKFDMYID